MTKRRFCFTFFLLICFSLPLTATAQTVDIPDPNLRAIIANELGKTSGEAITAADMARFGGIRLPNSNIRNLTGLEYATNLRVLNLGAVDTADGFRVNNNFISDISPLAGLTNLEELILEVNVISDISPLEGLNGLRRLFLGDNVISDISPLEGLNNLIQLGIERNLISDISPLEGLNNLTFLFFNGNSISDLSPLEGLNNLTWLFLAQNSISDLSPLVANTGLGSGDRVNVTDNPLNSQSINTHIPALQRRGVTVEFDAVIAEPVVIPDPNLRAAIATTLGKASSTVITTADMARLNRLVAPNASISNLTGLEHATNLTRLELGNELVQGNLINSNAITDISVLGQLTDLTYLDLDGNAITNISPLKELTNLTLLGLWSNSVSDISPLAGLNNLRDLNLGYNSISNISVLSGLTNLRGLFLRDNNISDISPLVANTGLGDGDRVWLQENPLNFASITTHIPALQSRGVTVEFDAVVAEPVDIPDPNLRAAIEEALGKASGATITTVDMATLTELGAINSNIANLTGLEHATNLRNLNLGEDPQGGRFINSNSVSDLSPIAGLSSLTELDLAFNSISDISLVAGLTNLTSLALSGNSISDISPIAGLINLTGLSLWRNSISDISPLVGLTNLTWLNLRFNSIFNISPLAELTNLTRLYINNNPTSDLSPIAGLTNLTSLHLGADSISDLSPLVGLTNLTWLRLWSNSISDLSPLAGLTNLTELSLRGNSISDISPLEGLTNLRWLSLSGNSISDISPLVANTGLGNGDFVDVTDNPLNAASINTHLPALQSRGVTVEFDAVVTEPVEIPDPNLRAAIARALGKAPGAVINTADMAGLNRLAAPNANISDLTGLEQATNLTRLELGPERSEEPNSNSITDISALQGLTNLTWLDLGSNSITDISALAGLTNLIWLDLGSNNISDISALAGLTRMEALWLESNNISDISALAGLTNLTELFLNLNSIENITPLAGLTNLTRLFLRGNSIENITPLAGLTNLTRLVLGNNSIENITPLAGLTSLTNLVLGGNSIENITPLAGLTNLTFLGLWHNSISVILPLEELTNLSFLLLNGNSIADISPLVANTGLGAGDTVNVSANPLSSESINTHIPALQNRGVEVHAENLIPTTLDYTLTIPAGISLIHVPLQVTAVDDVEQTIESVGDLYDALGGASVVNFLITYDPETQEWRSFFVPSDKGTPADSGLDDDMGIIVGLRARVSVDLRGNPLGTDGSSAITLHQGLNVVGLPLNDSRITRVSDLLTLEGIDGNIPVIILTDRGEFKLVGRAGDPGDIEITGGQAFIMTASRDATVNISGDGWANGSGTAAAPPLSLTGIEVGNTTPVLGLRGAIVDQGTGVNQVGLRVTVKNLSTGRTVAAVTALDETGYRLTVVDIETGRAAQIGDTLEISARSRNPFIGVEPLRYTVTAEDVKQSLIQLPELVAYEIPAEPQLLANYPNPFNPETWIPYRLAEDAFVTLTIYDGAGQAVRTIEVGHQTAAVYENRSKAIYWNGRNDVGEGVASGVYFYHLSAGDYSATRKMVILK